MTRTGWSIRGLVIDGGKHMIPVGPTKGSPGMFAGTIGSRFSFLRDD